MGRCADDQPFPGMDRWRNTGEAGLQLWQDADRAGKGLLTIVVPDLSIESSRLFGVGIDLQDKARGGFGAVAQILDAEDNRINLVEPPKGFSEE